MICAYPSLMIDVNVVDRRLQRFFVVVRLTFTVTDSLRIEAAAAGNFRDVWAVGGKARLEDAFERKASLDEDLGAAAAG